MELHLSTGSISILLSPTANCAVLCRAPLLQDLLLNNSPGLFLYIFNMPGQKDKTKEYISGPCSASFGIW